MSLYVERPIGVNFTPWGHISPSGSYFALRVEIKPQASDSSIHFVGTERERERMEEKRQRLEARKAAMTSTVESVVTSVVTEEATSSAMPVTPAAETKEAAKPLKIEVHATAMHHEQLVPKVAHSQNHDFGHNQAVSTFAELLFTNVQGGPRGVFKAHF
jgi:hypothetical protein